MARIYTAAVAAARARGQFLKRRVYGRGLTDLVIIKLIQAGSLSARVAVFFYDNRPRRAEFQGIVFVYELCWTRVLIEDLSLLILSECA